MRAFHCIRLGSAKCACQIQRKVKQFLTFVQIFPPERTQTADLGKKLLSGDCNSAKSMVFQLRSIGHENSLRNGREKCFWPMALL